MIVLKRDGTAVISEEVSFHDQPLPAPEEIDLPAAELDVDLWRREAVVVVEVEKGGLEIGAGATGLDAFEVMAFVLGLTDGAAEEVWREEG
ncbi:MAG: hypothetical protein ACTHNY_02185 [Solirubrobacterales bacterium]